MEKGRGTKMAKISHEVKKHRENRGPKKGQNVIRGKTALVETHPSWRARTLQRVPLQIRGSLVQLGGLFGSGEVPAPPITTVILDALDNHHPGLHSHS